MSWIEPSFLWMMYRSGWATKPDQEHELAIWIPRERFDEIVAAAVPSTFDQQRYTTREVWQAAVQNSEVRVQWDPDRKPDGSPASWRAVQLGVRGKTLRGLCAEWILQIRDITPWVREQAQHVADPAALVIPRQRPYPTG